VHISGAAGMGSDRSEECVPPAWLWSREREGGSLASTDLGVGTKSAMWKGQSEPEPRLRDRTGLPCTERLGTAIGAIPCRGRDSYVVQIYHKLHIVTQPHTTLLTAESQRGGTVSVV